jgi:hypothetical protein
VIPPLTFKSGLSAAGLVKELDRVFPDRAPERGETIEDLMFRAGQRSVVKWSIDFINDNGEEQQEG